VYNPAIAKNLCEVFLGSPSEAYPLGYSGRFYLLSKSGFICAFISVKLHPGFASVFLLRYL